MTVTNTVNGCINTVTKTDSVIAIPSPEPDFTISNVSNPNGCTPLNSNTINTTDTSIIAIASVLWDYGDGGTSTLFQPSAHTFTNAGSYLITLNSTNSLGCSNYTNQSIIVTSTPKSTFTMPATLCAGKVEDLTYTGGQHQGLVLLMFGILV
jgi:PKD repeat protein